MSYFYIHIITAAFCPQIQDDEMPNVEEPKKQMDGYKDADIPAERLSLEMASQSNPAPNQEV